MILLITRSSTEPTLFHVGCRPSLHVGILQHLYLTYSSERHSTHIHPGWNHILPQWWKIYVLLSRLEPHLSHNDGTIPYFHPSQKTSCSQLWKISSLSYRPEPHPAHNDERLSSMLEHILLTMMKYLCTYIHPGGNISCSQWQKGFALTSIQAGTHPAHNDWRALHSYLIL